MMTVVSSRFNDTPNHDALQVLKCSLLCSLVLAHLGYSAIVERDRFAGIDRAR
jgi:hypothetical protein